MNVVVNRKGVRLDLSSEQIDEMILHGFSSMAEYIDKRRALLYEKNKARLRGLHDFEDSEDATIQESPKAENSV